MIPMPGSSVQAAPWSPPTAPLLTQTSTVCGAVFLRPFLRDQQPAAMRNLAVFITVCAFITFMAYLSFLTFPYLFCEWRDEDPGII